MRTIVMIQAEASKEPRARAYLGKTPEGVPVMGVRTATEAAWARAWWIVDAESAAAARTLIYQANPWAAPRYSLAYEAKILDRPPGRILSGPVSSRGLLPR